jgi:hypothetical protein
MTFAGYKDLDRVMSFVDGEPPEVCIETGTLLGNATAVFASTFNMVHTIDLSKEHYGHAVSRFAGVENVMCHHGDSAVVLPLLLDQYKDERLFLHLDAHWFNDSRYPDIAADVPLPLWDELKALQSRETHDIVVVDDVHAFGKSKPSDLWKEVTFESIEHALHPWVKAMKIGDMYVVYR